MLQVMPANGAFLLNPNIYLLIYFMETLLGTQMHWLTLVFILIEFPLLIVQLFLYLLRPGDRQRLWYMILLGILIKYNVFNGLFPDPSLRLNIRLQIMIADGLAYLMGAYIPYYFYKAYNLETLRFHATWGVTFLILLPYVIFDVVYAINGDLIADREWGVIIPAVYGMVVFTAMLRAIIAKYRHTHKRRQFRCELAVWIAIIPWEVMVLFAFFPAPQWLRVLLANLGWLMISLLQFRKIIWHYRRQDSQLAEVKQTGTLYSVFEASCARYLLTEREIRIVTLLRQGYTYKQIGDELFLSEKTIDNNIQTIYAKVGVKSKMELIHRLWNDSSL
jgi:DNA-binding CsgD family transcriptional regulator